MDNDLERRFNITINNLAKIIAIVKRAKIQTEEKNLKAINTLEKAQELQRILVPADIWNLKDSVKRDLDKSE